jgi:hypothetical protein
MSEASERIYDEVWARSEAARLTDEQIIKFIYAPNSDNLTKAIRSRLADRIEALERENAALRDDDAKMQLLHRQEDQLIAAERKLIAAEAREARLSEALRRIEGVDSHIDATPRGDRKVICVEFADGFTMITSGNAIRRTKEARDARD